MVFFSEVQCPIYLSGWIAAKSVHLFVAHPERYSLLGETPPEELYLSIVNKELSVDEVIDQGEKIDDERSETEEGGTDGVSSTVVERKDEEDTNMTLQ